MFKEVEDFAAEVDRMLTAAAAAPLPDQCRVYADLRAKYEVLDRLRKDIGKVLDKTKNEVLPEAFHDAGVSSIKVEDYGTFIVNRRLYCSMPDREAGMAWLKAEGHGDLISETVNANTLSAFARSMIEEQGIDLPGELFKTSESNYVSKRKG